MESLPIQEQSSFAEEGTPIPPPPQFLLIGCSAQPPPSRPQKPLSSPPPTGDGSQAAWGSLVPLSAPANPHNQLLAKGGGVFLSQRRDGDLLSHHPFPQAGRG